jgi:hypothetical protein
MVELRTDSDPTLTEVKDFLRENWVKGCVCPACKQHVKAYNRKLSATMAYVLILMYRRDREKPGEYFHVSEYLDSINVGTSQRADWQKLQFFKCIESKEGIRDDGSNRVGEYRITETGIKFVTKQIELPKHCVMYNQRSFGYSMERVSITDALKEKFNYSELIQ